MIKTQDKRNEKIVALLEEGNTLAAVGKKFNLSRQRILQIARKFKIEQFGKAKQKAEKHYQANMERLLKYGITVDEIKAAKKDSFERACYLKYRTKKDNASRMGIEFTINLSDIYFPKVCPILGITLNYYGSAHDNDLASFDRIDPTKGYVKGNVHIISYKANRIKNNSTLDELKALYLYMDHIQHMGLEYTIANQPVFYTRSNEQ